MSQTQKAQRVCEQASGPGPGVWTGVWIRVRGLGSGPGSRVWDTFKLMKERDDETLQNIKLLDLSNYDDSRFIYFIVTFDLQMCDLHLRNHDDS